MQVEDAKFARQHDGSNGVYRRAVIRLFVLAVLDETTVDNVRLKLSSRNEVIVLAIDFGILLRPARVCKDKNISSFKIDSNFKREGGKIVNYEEWQGRIVQSPASAFPSTLFGLCWVGQSGRWAACDWHGDSTDRLLHKSKSLRFRLKRTNLFFFVENSKLITSYEA